MSNRDHPSFMPSGKPVIYDSRQKDGPSRRETPRERMARILNRSSRQRSNDAPSTGANPALIRTQHTTRGGQGRA
jgi:hypothetical protein